MRSSLLALCAAAVAARPSPRTRRPATCPSKDAKAEAAEARPRPGEGQRRGRRAAGAALDSVARPHPRLHRHAGPPDHPQRRGRADGEHVLRRLHGDSGERPAAAGHLPVQRRPRLLDHVAAHGLVRPDEGRRIDPRNASPAAVPLRRRIPTPCSTSATWSSSTRRRPACRARSARPSPRTSSASTRTSTPSPGRSSAT